MTITNLEIKLSSLGFALDVADLQTLRVKRIEDIIKNMDEEQLEAFAHDVVRKDSLFDALGDLGILIAPIKNKDVVIISGIISISKDIVDLEKDLVFVIDFDYFYVAFDTKFSQSCNGRLFFKIVNDECEEE